MNPDAPIPRVRIRQWLVEARLPPLVQKNVERIAGSDDVRQIIVLPDIHLGRDFNNGCAIATRNLVYPQAVGSDIGCGFSAIGFNGLAAPLLDGRHSQDLLRRLYEAVPALKRSVAQTLSLPAELHGRPLSEAALEKQSRRDGTCQFGTLGCGNHFLEFQRDDSDALWLMVHSGSRAMGQHITSHHLRRAEPSANGLLRLDARTPAGQAYLNDADWATRYATLNRLAIMARAVEIVQADFGIAANEDSYLDTPHNFIRREEHFGESLWVHRKSANSARQGEEALIAGSMGTPSLLVTGLGEEDSLCSSSHGAGRALSRTEARRTIRLADLQRQLGGVRHDPRNLDDLRDEAPGAYRNLAEVMRAQRALVRQLARMSPVLNFKYPDRRNG